MKIVMLFLAICLLISCSGNEHRSSSHDINREFRIEELKKDFIVLRAALEEAHPGMYRYTEKDQFDALFDSLHSENSRAMNELEFFRFISPIISQIKCGHTGISLSSDYWEYMTKARKYFPMQLKFISNKAYLLKNYSSDELIPTGSEIISINHTLISEITKMISTMISSDGNIQTAKYRKLDEDFSQLYFLYVNPADSFDITYITPNEKVLRFKVLPAIDWQQIWKYKSSYMTRQKEPLKFEIYHDSDVAVMIIVTFIPRLIKENFGNFFEFILTI